jgi:hypothetical protein
MYDNKNIKEEVDCHGPNAIVSIKEALLYMKDRLKKGKKKAMNLSLV